MATGNEAAIVGVVMGTVATIFSALMASIIYARSGCRKDHCCEIRFKTPSDTPRDTPSEVAAASSSAVITV